MTPQKTKVLSFLNELLTPNILYVELPKNWAKAYHFYNFWKWFVLSSENCVMYAFQRNLICTFIDQILSNKSPIKLGPQNYNLGNRYSNVDITSCLTMFKHMCSTLRPNETRSNTLHELTAEEKVCLQSIPFFKLMVEQKHDVASLCEYMVLVC